MHVGSVSRPTPPSPPLATARPKSVGTLPHQTISSSSTPIVLWHRDNAQPIEKIQAMWHVSVLRHFDVATDGSLSLDELHSLAHVWWPSVLAALKLSHWNIDRVFLDGYGASLNLESE